MPEYNLIQRPDLLYRLQQFLGLRQAHVTPTLNEGLQGVIVVADLDRPQRLEQRRRYSNAGTLALDGANLSKTFLATDATATVNVFPLYLLIALGINDSGWLTFEQPVAVPGALKGIGWDDATRARRSQATVDATHPAARTGLDLLTVPILQTPHTLIGLEGIKLTPGQSLSFFTNAVGEFLRWTWVWDEEPVGT